MTLKPLEALQYAEVVLPENEGFVADDVRRLDSDERPHVSTLQWYSQANELTQLPYADVKAYPVARAQGAAKLLTELREQLSRMSLQYSRKSRALDNLRTSFDKLQRKFFEGVVVMERAAEDLKIARQKLVDLDNGLVEGAKDRLKDRLAQGGAKEGLADTLAADAQTLHGQLTQRIAEIDNLIREVVISLGQAPKI